MTDRRDNAPPPDGWRTDARPDPFATPEPEPLLHDGIQLGEN